MRSLNRTFFDEMDNFFNQLAVAPAMAERVFVPAAEIAEEKEHYLMSIDLPGFKKEDINIDISENVLTLSGERKRATYDSQKNWQRAERSYGTFRRSFQLPKTVALDKIEAHYEDGVLNLYIPKAPPAEKRKIEIQTQAPSFFKKLENSQNTPSPH